MENPRRDILRNTWEGTSARREAEAIRTYLRGIRSGLPPEQRDAQWQEAARFLLAKKTIKAGQGDIRFEPAMFSLRRHRLGSDVHWDLFVLKPGRNNYWFGWRFRQDPRQSGITIGGSHIPATEHGDHLGHMFYDGDVKGHGKTDLVIRLAPAVLHKRNLDQTCLTFLGPKMSGRHLVSIKRGLNGRVSWQMDRLPKENQFSWVTMQKVAAQHIELEPILPVGTQQQLEAMNPKPRRVGEKIPYPKEIEFAVQNKDIGRRSGAKVHTEVPKDSKGTDGKHNESGRVRQGCGCTAVASAA